ncbi:MAG: hypothetical protein RL576_1013 [Actinomycetota bacterium]
MNAGLRNTFANVFVNSALVTGVGAVRLTGPESVLVSK